MNQSDSDCWMAINQAAENAESVSELTSDEVLVAYVTLSGRTNRERARAMLVEAGKRLKCATLVDKILKAAAREYRDAQARGGSFKSEFTDLPSEYDNVFTGEFECADNGIYINDEFGDRVCVCSHPIMPVRYTRDVDTGAQKVTLLYRKLDDWESITTSRRMISDRRQIIELSESGIDVTSETAGWLVRYLATVESLNTSNIARGLSCARMGWCNEGFVPYMKDVEFSGAECYADIFNAITTAGEYNEWKELVRPFYTENGLPRIILAASMAAPMVGMSDGLPFFCHLWGGTENGKTLSLMLAASVWGNPSRNAGLIHPFSATRVGMERLAECLHNLPVCLDELGVKSGGEKEIGEIVYMLTEGKGRPRGAIRGMQHTASWSTTFLTTGEHPLTEQNSRAGVINRTVSLACGSVGNNIYDDPQHVLAVIKSNYGYAGRALVEKLTSVGADTLRKMLDTNTQLLKTSDTVVSEKQMSAAAYLLTADALGQIAIFDDIIDDSGDISWLTKHLATMEDISNLPRALEWLEGWQVSNGRHFVASSSEAEGVDVWGFLRPDKRWAYVATKLRADMEREGFSYSAFLSDAAAAGVIMTSGGKNTIPCRIGKTLARCIVMSAPVPESGVPGWQKILP